MAKAFDRAVVQVYARNLCIIRQAGGVYRVAVVLRCDADDVAYVRLDGPRRCGGDRDALAEVRASGGSGLGG